MTYKNALRRYLKIFIPMMGIYGASCFVVPTVLGRGDFSAPITYLMALIPAVCIAISMWSQWRFAQEVDEFWRGLLNTAALVGLTFVMSASAAWGFLEFFASAPHLSLFYVVPGFYAAFGIAYGVIVNRATGGLGLKGEV